MHRSIYILILACTFFFNAKAQENNTINIDSIIDAVKSKYDPPTMESEEGTSVDTTLTANQLTIPGDSVESWKNLPAFAYAKYLDSLLKAKQDKEKIAAQKPVKSKSSSSSSTEKPEIVEPDKPGVLDAIFSSQATMVILWILAGIFVLFILSKLFLTGVNPFKRKTKTLPQTMQEFVEEEVTSESDFDSMISQAVRKENYRLAVRYQYLKSLHRLADKNFIQMATDKTNYQYVRELGSRGPAVNQQFQNDFASLTLNYEYVWYGEFAVEDTVYNRIARGFNEFNQKI